MTRVSLSAFSLDGYNPHRSFDSLAEAQAWAAERVGPTPELGTSYAVSGDGVVTLYWAGCDGVDLFPALAGDDWASAEHGAIQAERDAEDYADHPDDDDYTTTHADGTVTETQWNACEGAHEVCLDCGLADGTGDEDWDTHDSRCSRRCHTT